MSVSIAPLAPRLARFRKDEGGALIIFALMLFVLMCMFGGMAVDIMRYETARTNLQNTLDRATLAAASLEQTLDPEDVVRDYLAKQGMQDQITAIEVDDGENLRRVRAFGAVDTKPFFLHMIGIDEFDAKGVSAAQQGISDIEIVLVLDVSGSMSGQKITRLKEAASQFVQTVLGNDTEGRVSIAIVPYNAQVNLGAPLRAKFSATHQHGVAYVNCLELPSTAFDQPEVPRDMMLPMMAYADHAYGTNKINGYVAPTDTTYARPNFGAAFCKPTTVNTVTLLSNDIATLQARINSLAAGGNTSITLGMKWGMTLIDPTARGMYGEFIADGAMDAGLAGRPYDYTDDDADKIIVLMTDGEHVSHNRITDGYKTGPSTIWLSTGDGRYSVYHASRPGTDKYYVPHLNSWQAAAWNSGAGAVQQNWETVWTNLKASYVAWQFYARALGTSSTTRNAAYDAQMAAMVQTWNSVSNMNTSLQASCAQTKAAGVTVYGIAFEAPANGQSQISQCASSGEYYFDAADGDELAGAFDTIAADITKLKLTQ